MRHLPQPLFVLNLPASSFSGWEVGGIRKRRDEDEWAGRGFGGKGRSGRQAARETDGGTETRFGSLRRGATKSVQVIDSETRGEERRGGAKKGISRSHAGDCLRPASL